MSEMGKSWREEILEPLNLALLAASGTQLLNRPFGCFQRLMKKKNGKISWSYSLKFF